MAVMLFTGVVLTITLLIGIVSCSDGHGIVSMKFEQHQLPLVPHKLFWTEDEKCRKKFCDQVTPDGMESCGLTQARYVINCIIRNIRKSDSIESQNKRFLEKVADEVKECQKDVDNDSAFLFGSGALSRAYREVFMQSVHCGWKNALKSESLSEDLIVDALTKAQEFCESFSKEDVKDSSSEIEMNLCIYYDVWESMLSANFPIPGVLERFSFYENLTQDEQKANPPLREKLTSLALMAQNYDKQKAMNKTLSHLEECLRENKFLQPQDGDYEDITRKNANGRRRNDLYKFRVVKESPPQKPANRSAESTSASQAENKEGEQPKADDKTAVAVDLNEQRNEAAEIAVERKKRHNKRSLKREQEMQKRDYYGADDDDDDDDAKGDYDYGAKKEGGGGGGYDDEEEAQPDVEYDHGVYVSKYVENKVNVFRCAFNKYRRKTTENNDRGGETEGNDEYDQGDQESEVDDDYENGPERSGKNLGERLRVNTSLVGLLLLAVPLLATAAVATGSPQLAL